MSCPGGGNKDNLCRNSGLRMVGQTTIDSVGEKYNDELNLVYYSAYAAPADYDECNRHYNSTSLPLQGMLLPGDSGGGFYKEINGEWKLVALPGYSFMDHNDPGYMLNCGHYGLRKTIVGIAPF